MPIAPRPYRVLPVTGERVPRTTRVLSKRRFMGRLSLAEQVALNYVRLNPETDPALRAQLETLKELRDMVDEVHLDDPDTLVGQQIALAVLSSLPEGTPGRVDPADVPARLEAWRMDYPQPGELVT